MASSLVEIAEAVKDALNGASLSMAFTAVREYVPVYDLRDLATLRVSVVPVACDAVPLTRNSDDFAHEIHVVVQRKIDSDSSVQLTNSELDPYMTFVGEIIDLFRGSTIDGATCASIENDPAIDHAKVDEARLFVSSVQMMFRKARGR